MSVVLTTTQAPLLARCVAAFRTDWDAAGVTAAVNELAPDPRHWSLIVRQVWVRATDPQSKTPKALLFPLDTTTAAPVVEPLGSPRAPRRDDPECPMHGGQIVNDRGQFTCCRYDTDPIPPAYVRCGTSGPPANFRELVAAARPNVHPSNNPEGTDD